MTAHTLHLIGAVYATGVFVTFATASMMEEEVTLDIVVGSLIWFLNIPASVVYRLVKKLRGS